MRIPIVVYVGASAYHATFEDHGDDWITVYWNGREARHKLHGEKAVKRAAERVLKAIVSAPKPPS